MAEALAWPWSAGGPEMKQRVANAKVLAVGAGGIGCELLKTLVLTGFRAIEVVDLDTIEVSNLNRQFLFRRQHVGQSKAEVAAAAVKRVRPDVDIVAHHGNVKEGRFGVDFFRRFDMVLNGLDNLDARRHVNRMCLAAGVPLVESGTAGYLGQVTVHVGGKTECFECQPKPVPKTFAICTIRNTPDKPVHCIEWAKSHLLPLLFGPADAGNDLDDGGEAAEPLARGEGEAAAAFAERVFRRVFGSDIAALASVEGMWETRTPPVALDLDAIRRSAGAGPVADGPAEGGACKALGLVDQHAVWDAAQNAAVFVEATRRFLELRADEIGSVAFDKDDDLAVEFVTAASNLRSLCYSIPPQSLFDAKGMAGNIIHAIATTNAIISGLIVVEALKLLANPADPAACRSTFLRQDLSGRRLVTPAACEPPSAGCCVCGKAQMTLHIDTQATTLAELLDRVLRGRLGLVAPGFETEDLWYEDRDWADAEEEAKCKSWLPRPLAALPGGAIRHGTELEVEDQVQKVKVRILVQHREEWEEEAHPQRFELTGSAPEAAATDDEGPADAGGAVEGAAAAQAGKVTVHEDENGVVEILEEDAGPAGSAAAPANGKRKAGGDGGGEGEGPSKRARADGGGDDDAVIELL